MARDTGLILVVLGSCLVHGASTLLPPLPGRAQQPYNPNYAGATRPPLAFLSSPTPPLRTRMAAVPALERVSGRLGVAKGSLVGGRRRSGLGLQGLKACEGAYEAPIPSNRPGAPGGGKTGLDGQPGVGNASDMAEGYFWTSEGGAPAMDYFGESTRGDLVPNLIPGDGDEMLSPEQVTAFGEDLGLDRWGTPTTWGLPAEPQRAIFCSRTLNLRSISCVGYDMDYTLIHYKVVAWEGRAYHYAKKNLKKVGFPVDKLEFNPELVCRGTIIDKKLGNLVKVDRFGYVKRAMHGTKRLTNRETHDIYGRLLVDLREGQRWLFLNTLFSVSEGCLYSQLVEMFDHGELSVDTNGKPMELTYQTLFNAVSKALFKAHVQGRLKADVMKSPEKYVEFDEDLPKTLLDQGESGKKLALITNSDWEYTKVMMHHVFDKFLPSTMTWRDLFHVIIVSARKPAFFSQTMPLYEIVTEDGMMREKFRMKEGRIYSGGSASMVEALFNVSSDEVMYVGDHIFADLNVAKGYMRWRTALIVREFEEEVVAIDRGKVHTEEVIALIKAKEKCSNILNHLRTEMHRYKQNRSSAIFNQESEHEMYQLMSKLLATMIGYDRKIAPMLYHDGSHFNKYWGYISRGGFNDQSHFMRQIEKYCDVYTSRVSNFLRYTPYMYFRNSRLQLAHHRSLDRYRSEVPRDLLDDLGEYSTLRQGEQSGSTDEVESDADFERTRSPSPEGGSAGTFSPATSSYTGGGGIGSSQPAGPSYPNSRAAIGGYANSRAAAADDDLGYQQDLWQVQPSNEFGHAVDGSGISELDELKEEDVYGDRDEETS